MNNEIGYDILQKMDSIEAALLRIEEVNEAAFRYMKVRDEENLTANINQMKRQLSEYVGIRTHLETAGE